MKRYRGRAVVEAMQVLPGGRNHSDLIQWGCGLIRFDVEWGEFMVKVGDTAHFGCPAWGYIVKVNGVFIEPMRAKEFREAYEEV